ncbi:hypothetical protein AMATHDRAFT_199279 [Amanita thiersii Skay4041]|uniref:NADP-dependent oxidoreductase domain-containing protein n=1 Tax=Amanita thiersii Skay4041 TaxID=703135 RepID=A0A2A9N9D5_9AGAR|nr:hypothetical protein AMATHDRAFT_199279 [Amanita thiersii Skay4041]
MAVPFIELNNGRTIPAIGFGTFQSKPEEAVDAVCYALKEAGYRHIDCAWVYGNEASVGKGIEASGVPRSEIFITSKVWGTYHSRVEESLNQTLANLGTDYLDLYLMHWPVPLNPKGNHPSFPTLPDGKRDVDHAWDIRDTWKQMEGLVKKGKVKTIGVSNCSQTKLEHLLETAEIVPAVNQVRLRVCVCVCVCVCMRACMQFFFLSLDLGYAIPGGEREERHLNPLSSPPLFIFIVFRD